MCLIRVLPFDSEYSYIKVWLKLHLCITIMGYEMAGFTGKPFPVELDGVNVSGYRNAKVNNAFFFGVLIIIIMIHFKWVLIRFFITIFAHPYK